MALSCRKHVAILLWSVDILLLMSWLVTMNAFPTELDHSSRYLIAGVWFIGLVLIGGQNPSYLEPRSRIFITMTLPLILASMIAIARDGNWHDFLPGDLSFIAVFSLLGIISRFTLANYLRHAIIQLVPYHVPETHRHLLNELAAHPNVHVEDTLDAPDNTLPARQPGFTASMAVSDLRLQDMAFETLLPLYSRIGVIDICEVYEHVFEKVAVIRTGNGWTVPLQLHLLAPMQRRIMRALDLLFVFMSIPIILPLVGLAALLIKLTSPGPVFFYQERLGRLGHPFKLVKLRTMTTDAEISGPKWSTGSNDPRVTTVGRFLRLTGIDEFPQLWNVVRGEMGLVGPRPELPVIAQRLMEEITFYPTRLQIPPGITGWAQLHQGGDLTLDDVHNKLCYDLYYLKHFSPVLYLHIILRTVQMLFQMAKPGQHPVLPAHGQVRQV